MATMLRESTITANTRSPKIRSPKPPMPFSSAGNGFSKSTLSMISFNGQGAKS